MKLRLLVFVFFLHASISAVIAGESQGKRLTSWLAENRLDEVSMDKLQELPWAKSALTKLECKEAASALWTARKQQLKSTRKAEHEARSIELSGLEMPFWFQVFGDPPESGRSLYISMHGGGGAPTAVNNGQYENQKKLYQPAEGVYLVPRAPTDTWNLWHQAHIDEFFDRLITNMIVFEGVDPNKVYLMGYSAGGDGVYQLAPRMADRFAAASMMAGHPNEAKADGLRNLPFALFMGAKDGAYSRNRIAAEREKRFADLQQKDPKGYTHSVSIFEGMGHWMQRKDAVALPWMAKFERRQFPDRIVWYQDDVVHSQAYWLRTSSPVKAGDTVVAVRDGNTFQVESSSVNQLTILLNDEFADLDQPVTVNVAGQQEFQGTAIRTIGTLVRSLLERSDPQMLFSAEVNIDIGANR